MKRKTKSLDSEALRNIIDYSELARIQIVGNSDELLCTAKIQHSIRYKQQPR